MRITPPAPSPFTLVICKRYCIWLIMEDAASDVSLYCPSIMLSARFTEYDSKFCSPIMAVSQRNSR